MSEKAESFAAEAEELFERKMREFVRWAQENWRLGDDNLDPDLTGELVEGWNRCLDGLGGAVDLWMEEDS